LLTTLSRRIIIRETNDAASRYVADFIVTRITTFNPTRARPFFVLGLPTGSSPELIYAYLVRAHKAGKISFRNVVTFNMDEYVGLPQGHEQSYHTFMYRHLLAHVDIPPANVHILDGEADDLLEECARYETAIRSYGGIDLFLAGVGADGHIAFNEPGSSLASRTRVKTLAQDTRVANSRFFGDDVELVPKMALTVGVGTVMDAKEVVVIATGEKKAVAVRMAVEEGVNHWWTMSALQMHANMLLVVDEEATGELKVKTVQVSVGCVGARFEGGVLICCE
jgi:glucosamine-6-phosphate deaminase